MKKFLNQGVSIPLAIAIIIVLVIIAGGAILAYQYYYIPKQETNISLPQQNTTTNETANQKTYRNEECGISFDYPASYSFKETDLDIKDSLWFGKGNVSFIDLSNQDKSVALWVRLIKNKGKFTFDEFMEKYIAESYAEKIPGTGKVFFKENFTTEKGIKGYKISATTPNPSHIYDYQFVFNIPQENIPECVFIAEYSRMVESNTQDLNSIIQSLNFIKKQTYNHAGEIVKVYQKDGKEYLDINFIKFLLFVDKDNHPISTPGYIYGENDEKGDCKPVADPYCIVDNNKTIKSFEVAKNVEIMPAGYPGNPVSYNELGGLIINSPYFRLQIENDIIQKMEQIYIP